MTFQAEKMTVNRIEIVNFHSVDCFKASFKKGVNVINNKKVLEIILMLISGIVPDSKKCKNASSFVRADCSVGKSKFKIEIKNENDRYVVRSPLSKMTPIEQRMSCFGLNKYDWSKEFYGYLNQDECYPYNLLPAPACPPARTAQWSRSARLPGAQTPSVRSSRQPLPAS